MYRYFGGLLRRVRKFSNPRGNRDSYARGNLKPHGRFVTGEGLRIRGYDVKCYPRWAEGTPLDDDVRVEIRALLEAATPEEATSRVALA